MSTHRVEVTITTKTKNFEEVDEEISRLKLVIGILLAKLPPDARSEFIKDLQRFGLNEEAALFSKFTPN